MFLIVHITMTFVCVLRVMYMCPFLAIIVYFIIVIITTILFFSTLTVIGGEFSNWIQVAWSTPTHWLIWVSRRVSIIFICILFFFVSYSLVTTVEVLMPCFIFIIWHHLIMMPREARDVGLSCRCHLSNSHIVFSV